MNGYFENTLGAFHGGGFHGARGGGFNGVGPRNEARFAPHGFHTGGRAADYLRAFAFHPGGFHGSGGMLGHPIPGGKNGDQLFFNPRTGMYYNQRPDGSIAQSFVRPTVVSDWQPLNGLGAFHHAGSRYGGRGGGARGVGPRNQARFHPGRGFANHHAARLRALHFWRQQMMNGQQPDGGGPSGGSPGGYGGGDSGGSGGGSDSGGLSLQQLQKEIEQLEQLLQGQGGGQSEAQPDVQSSAQAAGAADPLASAGMQGWWQDWLRERREQWQRRGLNENRGWHDRRNWHERRYV